MTVRISHLAKNQRSSTAVTPASPQHHSLAHTCSAPALSSSPLKAPLLFFAPPVTVTGPAVCSCSRLHRYRLKKMCRKAHVHHRVTQATPLMRYSALVEYNLQTAVCVCWLTSRLKYISFTSFSFGRHGQQWWLGDFFFCFLAF